MTHCSQVYHTATGALAYLLKDSVLDEMPITSLRFRPASSSSKTKNVLLAVGADGVAKHWHITSSKCMHTIVEPDNQLYCVDYRQVPPLCVRAIRETRQCGEGAQG